MTMTDPLKDRARVEKQIAAAWEMYSSSAAARQQADVQRGKASRELDRLRIEWPAGRAAEKDVQAAERALASAEREYRVILERERGALTAAKACEAELMDMLRDPERVEAYAEQAEAVTEQAVQALQAATDALGQAQKAWIAAAAAWGPLCKAHAMRLVGPWPLPDVTDMRANLARGALAPRPPEVTRL